MNPQHPPNTGDAMHMNGAPPMMNPPPQPFGGNNYDAHPSPPFQHDMAQSGASWGPLGDQAYDYDDDGQGGIGGDNDGECRDAKRRRIARACDMCRKKKIKCDGKMPKCSHCENYKTECIFTPVEKKRAPPKGAKYIEGLENRLKRMEGLLHLSGLIGEDDGGRTDLGTLEKRLAERQSLDPGSNAASPISHLQSQHQSQHASPAGRGGPANHASTPANNGTPHTEELRSPQGDGASSKATPQRPGSTNPSKPPKKDVKEVDALADQMCSLITNNCGETRYIGSSSGFSIFSPKGIQWVNEKTGDNSFHKMIAGAAAEDKVGWDHWRPEIFNDLFARRVFKPLPDRQECYALLKDYFENFNCMFPLFHEPTFMHLVDKHYSAEPYEGSGWWASLNVALAIAHRLRVMSNVVDSREDDYAWAYLKNAMAVMTELTMRNTDLLSVQALLGMSLFLQGTSNPQPTFFLIAAAIRLAHSIGLHKRGSGFNLNEVENEQRKRVFWIAYMLDKDICLRSGRPPAQDDDDLNVELPSEDPPDNVGNIPLAQEVNGKRTMNLFRLTCRFAQIQSRVYKQLYSVEASRQSDGELLNTIGDLDAHLEEWKDSIPLDFRPEHEIKAAHTPLIVQVVVLHFAYYNCLTTIHRMSVHHGYWTSRLSDFALQGLNARPLNPRVFMSAALCVNAARTSIGLIRYIPQGDYACVWLILYYPVSSLVTLFANILQNPQDARARGDLRLMNSVCSFLSMLERDAAEASGNVRRMLAVCSEFERIAKVVLDKAEREIKGRGKRKQGDRDKGDAGEVARGLDAGKTMEQMQVETQSAYRTPVQTSTLQASEGRSPASWSTGSQPGGTQQPKPHPSNQYQGNAQQPSNQSTWDPTPFTMPPNSYNTSHPTHHPHQQHQQQPNQSFTNTPPFGPDPLDTDPFNNPMFTPDPSDPLAGLDFSTFTLPNTSAPNPTSQPQGPGQQQSGLAAAGSFQQPFVPQDLWQMPMTLEWDWAEGFGLGQMGAFGGMGMGMGNMMGFGDGGGDGGHDGSGRAGEQRQG